MAKEYNLHIITEFNNNGESLDSSIIKILNNNFFSAEIDFHNTSEYNMHK